MFGKLNKVLLGVALTGSIMSVHSSEIIPTQQIAGFMASSLIDSLKYGEPSETFLLAMRSREAVSTGLTHICEKSRSHSAEQKFYSTLSQIFSRYVVPEVTDSALNLILESALNGYKDADSIIKAISAGNSILTIDAGSYPSLKESIKKRLQGLIDESSSDDEEQISGGMMKEAKHRPELDRSTIAEIERATSPENMQKIASRYASNPANVLLIDEYVGSLFTSYSEKTAGKLKRVIGNLLQDEEPNNAWISSLISELKNSDATKKLYDELVAMIMW